MATAKQIGMVGAFVVALIVGAPGTASADFVVSGRLYDVGDEPRAEGSWTAVWDYSVWHVDVRCRRLTPGETYLVVAGDGGQWFVAKSGANSGRVQFLSSSAPATIEVYRVDGDAFVLVLSSEP